MKSRRIFTMILVFAVLIAGSILPGACAPAAPATPTVVPTLGPLDLVKAFETAFNQHDLEAAMGLMTEGVIYRWGGWGTSWGYDDTQTFLKNWFFGLNSEVHFTDCTPDAMQVTCKSVYVTNWGTAAGLSDGYHFDQSVFSFEDNKISKIEDGFDRTEESAQISNFSNAFWSWLYKNYPDEYEKYINDTIADGAGELYTKRTQEFAATLK